MAATVDVRLWSGSRERMGLTPKGMVTVRDPAKQNHTFHFTGDPVTIKGIPAVTDQGSRDCAVIATAKDCSDGGFFPLQLIDNEVNPIDLMLPPRKSAFTFADGTWERLKENCPDLRRLLETASNASVRYTELIEDSKKQRHIATLLNIAAAIECLPLPEKVLPMLKQMELTTDEGDQNRATGLRQDRFFVWADKSLKDILSRNSTDKKENANPIFEQEKNPQLVHKGADLSYKEIRFGEGNLQFTFLKEEFAGKPPSEGLVKLELDMDYFRDAGSHAVLEFIPNLFIGAIFKVFGGSHKTNPKSIYALRWMAGKRLKDEKEFNPLYKLVQS